MRPILTPFATARARPSPVRARINSRSNSASPPSTVSLSRPCAVVVSAHVSARDPNQGTTPQLGFIAQQVETIFPNLVATTSPTALTPDGTLSLNYIGLISPIVSAIQALSAEVASIENTIAGFAESFTTNNLTYTRANGVITSTQTLCLTDGANDPSSICITKEQLAALLSQAGTASNANPPIGSTSNQGDATDTPPVIQVNGDNPATVAIGATYTDLGATIEGPQQDLNLGITTYVNGTQMNPVQIDTSIAATDTIDYVATDQTGLTATSTRTVIIDPASVSSSAGAPDTTSSATTSSAESSPTASTTDDSMATTTTP